MNTESKQRNEYYPTKGDMPTNEKKRSYEKGFNPRQNDQENQNWGQNQETHERKKEEESSFLWKRTEEMMRAQNTLMQIVVKIQAAQKSKETRWPGQGSLPIPSMVIPPPTRRV